MLIECWKTNYHTSVLKTTLQACRFLQASKISFVANLPVMHKLSKRLAQHWHYCALQVVADGFGFSCHGHKTNEACIKKACINKQHYHCKNLCCEFLSARQLQQIPFLRESPDLCSPMRGCSAQYIFFVWSSKPAQWACIQSAMFDRIPSGCHISLFLCGYQKEIWVPRRVFDPQQAANTHNKLRTAEGKNRAAEKRCLRTDPRLRFQTVPSIHPDP